MNHNVTLAVMRLQRRLQSNPNSTSAEQCAQALDLLLNQPDNRAPPETQIRNAMSEAGKKLARRQQLLATPAAQAGLAVLAAPAGSGGLEWLLNLELEDFIDRMASASDRPLLRHALAGAGSLGIALELDISIGRARERLSRARTRAFRLWIN